MKADNNKPRGFSSLSDAMGELRRQHEDRVCSATTDENPPPDQGEVALRVQLPELIEIENTVRETIGPETTR